MSRELSRAGRRLPGIAALAFVAWLAASPAPAAEEKAPAAQPAQQAAVQPTRPAEPPLIEPEARAAVKRMVDVLRDAKAMSFEYTTAYDSIQDDGEMLEFGGRGKVTIRRPDRLRGEVWYRDGRHLQYAWDGKKFAMLGVVQNVYASTPRTGDLDSLIDFLRDDVRLKMPVADLFSSDLGPLLIENVIAARYIGKEQVGGDETEHVALRLRIGVDVQLWIRTKDGLPERIVLNYATADGRPTFRGEFTDWSLNPKTNESLFVLNAPKGAKELPIAIRPRPGTATVEPEDN